MKRSRITIIAITSFYLFSDFKLFHASDPSENTDGLLKRQLASNILEFSNPYEVGHFDHAVEEKLHGGHDIGYHSGVYGNNHFGHDIGYHNWVYKDKHFGHGIGHDNGVYGDQHLGHDIGRHKGVYGGKHGIGFEKGIVGFERGKHKGNYGKGGKKKVKRAVAKFQLHNLLKSSANVQKELLRQDAINKKLAKELEQQKLFPPPPGNLSYKYGYGYPIQSTPPYYPQPQEKAGSSYNSVKPMTAIVRESVDYSHSPVGVSEYDSNGSGYAAPVVFENSSSKGAAYAPVNAGTYYNNLRNSYGV